MNGEGEKGPVRRLGKTVLYIDTNLAFYTIKTFNEMTQGIVKRIIKLL